MTSKKITVLPAADALTGAELLAVVQDGDTQRSTLNAVNAFILNGLAETIRDTVGDALTDSPTIAFDVDDAGDTIGAHVPDGAITDDKLASDSVTTVKILDANVTIEKLSLALQALIARIPPVPDTNSDTAAGASYTLIIETDNNGIFCFGGTAGKYGIYDWTTQTWTEGTLTGASVLLYTWVSYAPASDLIWAGTTTVTHTINPATKVATNITGTSGAVIAAVYNPISQLMYGILGADAHVYEFNPATGAVVRTFNYVGASAGFRGIGCDIVNGNIYVQAENTGSGGWVAEIPYVAFNAAARVSSGVNVGNMAQGDSMAVDGINKRLLLFGGTIIVYIDLSVSGAMAAKEIVINNTNYLAYSPVLERIYYTSGPSKYTLNRIDPSADDAAAEATAYIVPDASGQANRRFIASRTTPFLYMLTSTPNLIRIRG